METPLPYQIAGIQLRCPHCQHDRFFFRSFQLNTAGMAFLNLDWLNDSATNYVCARCGRIEWFTFHVLTPPSSQAIEGAEGSQSPLSISATAAKEGETGCLECHAIIPAGASTCPKCGWTYL